MMSGIIRLAFTTLVVATICSPALAGLTPAETRLLAIELGATPEALTAVGFSLSAAQQALTRLAGEEEAATALRQHHQQVTGLQANLKTLHASARAAADTIELQQIESQISTARIDLGTAIAQAEAARSHLVSALVGSAADLTLSERVFAPCSLPAAYRTAELTNAQAAELRSALAAERHAQVRSQSPSNQVQQTLTAFRLIPAVSLALGSQVSHLEEVRQLFLITE